MSRNAYIAVHGGAGTHSVAPRQERDVKDALKLACMNALQKVAAGDMLAPALSMAENAISSLEDAGCLNAGYGSNLTLSGIVECDAAIMSGRCRDFGSVGAVAGVKNPIRLARVIHDYSKQPDLLGRVPPLSVAHSRTLVSQGAHDFGAANPDRVRVVPPESLVTAKAVKRWKTWKRRLEAPSTVDKPQVGLNDIQDTVGAVAWHEQDGVAAGVSSGGILLKYPGRVGQAAIFGAGCWAEHLPSQQGVAVSVSGTGEYIVRASLASTIAHALRNTVNEDAPDPHEVLRQALTSSTMSDHPQETHDLNPAAGVILLTTRADDRGIVSARLWCAFTTPSMAFGYASLKNPKPKAMILRRPVTQGGSPSDRIFITAVSLG